MWPLTATQQLQASSCLQLSHVRGAAISSCEERRYTGTNQMFCPVARGRTRASLHVGYLLLQSAQGLHWRWSCRGCSNSMRKAALAAVTPLAEKQRPVTSVCLLLPAVGPNFQPGLAAAAIAMPEIIVVACCLC
eukprot:GHUV01003070.1.p2 GENE.GHUV01003070.1~~GHUV01003070.1.p2  ORF type:complete len:134 (+),score=36.91 GHUV01003070.1:917-1318(+)